MCPACSLRKQRGGWVNQVDNLADSILGGKRKKQRGGIIGKRRRRKKQKGGIVTMERPLRPRQRAVYI
jgi:hypothetical protein